VGLPIRLKFGPMKLKLLDETGYTISSDGLRRSAYGRTFFDKKSYSSSK
jgi:hypothetical protein